MIYLLFDYFTKDNNYNELTAESESQEKRTDLIEKEAITKCNSSYCPILTGIFRLRPGLLGIEITYFCICKRTGTCQRKIND